MKQNIEALADGTSYKISSKREVNYAFLLGLWCKRFPDYAPNDLHQGAYGFHQLSEELKTSLGFSLFSSNSPEFDFAFISDTSTSWQRCYQDFRNEGWKRIAVARKKELLVYLLEIHDETNPEGYEKARLLLRISIATCKRVKVGEKTVVEEIFEVQCDGLADEVDGLEMPVLAPGDTEMSITDEPDELKSEEELRIERVGSDYPAERPSGLEPFVYTGQADVVAFVDHTEHDDSDAILDLPTDHSELEENATSPYPQVILIHKDDDIPF